MKILQRTKGANTPVETTKVEVGDMTLEQVPEAFRKEVEEVLSDG